MSSNEFCGPASQDPIVTALTDRVGPHHVDAEDGDAIVYCIRCGRSDGARVIVSWYDDQTGPQDDDACTICVEEAHPS